METENEKLKWDHNLQLSDENFGEKLTTNCYDSEAASTNHFPSDYTLAQFAKVATFDEPFPFSEDWELLTTAKNTSARNGYFGAAFFNRQLCQVVITHRGLSIPAGFVAHPVALFNRMSSDQAQSAVTFVQQVRQRISGRSSDDGPKFQLSITGYSLGAWLAQITTFTAKYLKRRKGALVADEDFSTNIHAHAVVFHSPGCRSLLENLIKKYIPHYVCRKYVNYDRLDMTVYLGSENSGNTIEEQVGTIFVLQYFLHTMDDYIRSFNTTTHQIEGKLVLDFMLACKNRPCAPNECSLNVFDEQERKFLHTWSILAANCPVGVLQRAKQKYSAPQFEIDTNLSIMRAENLNQAIAFIKLLKHKDLVVQDFW